MAFKNTNWSLLLLLVVVSAGAGYFLGKMSAGNGETTDTGGSGQSAEAAVEPTGSEAAPEESQGGEQQAKKLDSSQLAKEKNVPEKVDSAQGDFVLIAVIEGEEANRRLQSSLQVVNSQRQRLAQLSQQYNRTDPKLAQQRELVAGQINEVRQSLERNLMFMAQNFGYTLSNNYLLVPHRATLNAVIGQGEDQVKNEVYTFNNSDAYDKFQKKTDTYAQLKIAQARAYRETQTDEEKKQPLPKLPLTQEMEKLRKETMDLYKCDMEKSYLISIQKSALYARRAQ